MSPFGNLGCLLPWALVVSASACDSNDCENHVVTVASMSLLQARLQIKQSCPTAEYLQPPWVTGEELANPYEDIQCTQESLAGIQEFSQEKPFLIISGQGGSDTRAAQEAVQNSCTHAFGTLDTDTHDSWACRFAASPGFDDPNVEAILKHAGTVNYSIESLPAELRSSEAKLACQTCAILKEMVGSSANPMAMKEPWLRISLPFYSSIANIKFVHVTRDVRNIHYSHGEELFGKYVLNNMDVILKDVDEIALRGVSPTPGTMTWGKFSKWPKQLQQSKTGELQQLAVFANTWATMELTLHDKWMSAWPDKYYHLSEHRILTESRTEATRLAHFLGNMHPDEATLTSMMSVYLPEQPTKAHKDHWDVMQAIVAAPSSSIVRAALAKLGYAL